MCQVIRCQVSGGDGRRDTDEHGQTRTRLSTADTDGHGQVIARAISGEGGDAGA